MVLKNKGNTRPTLVAKYPLAVKFAGMAIASSNQAGNPSQRHNKNLHLNGVGY